MQQEEFQFKQIVERYKELSQSFVRQRKILAITAATGTLLAVLVALIYPATYRSSTSILIQSQRVPSNYVHSPISVDLGERLGTLTPQIMSRTRLEQIIRKFNLYGEQPSVQSDPKTMEGRVDVMRKAINVQVKGEDTFRIYYEHRSPELSMLVTNELARLFIEENLRDREQQAVSTSEFLDSELQNLKGQLETQEASLRNFKEDHIGELPEQQNANLRALDRFQAQYQANGESLQAARSRKNTIEAQLYSTESKEGDESQKLTPSEPLLERLRQELRDLRTQYTEEHPDIRSLNRRISEMERKLSELRASGTDTSGRKDPYVRSIMDKVAQVNNEIAQLEGEQEALNRNIRIYQRRIERLPEIEEKLTLLTRDYETTRQNYQALLNKKFEAQLSVNLERKQQGDAFKILDPAFLPSQPVRPRRLFIALLGFLASCGLGCGVAFVMDGLDTTIRSRRDLAKVSKLPILAVIPTLSVPVLSSEDSDRKSAAG